MTRTIIQQLARFTDNTSEANLPTHVLEESRRLLLDSIGCALAATDHPKGVAGVEYGKFIGVGQEEATVLGTGEKLSVLGAAFANAELINALDFDPILPPGHVTPYVLPAALAVAESAGASGAELLVSIAISHEISYRIGKAMDYLRDTADGVATPPKVYGYSSTVFGATAAVAKLMKLPVATTANALGIAGSLSPVNAHWAWVQHAPSTTIKYLLAGGLVQTAMTAAYMGKLGHRGDVRILDDREYGYPRFIGTSRWVPGPITTALGEEWRFPGETSYKPYPHCRILHSLLDVLIELVETHDIQPAEIESIVVSGEAFAEQPIWINNEIGHVVDAQFSVAHGIAVGAHRLPPGRAWQDPELVFSPSVLALMHKVVQKPHPDYVKHLRSNAASRPARIELRARGKVFIGEKLYPKGSPSPDPDSAMTTSELIEKFRHNAQGILSSSKSEAVIESIMRVEKMLDIRPLMQLLRDVVPQ